jgi:uncharacterized RDD family membrane protein YckC
MSDMWYYAVAGEQKGPVSIGELQKVVKAAGAGPDDLAWREGMDQWTAISKINELAIFLPSRPLAGASRPAEAPLDYRTLSPEGMIYAGFWIRALAYLIDCAICFIPVCVIAVIVLNVSGYATPDQTPGQTASTMPLWICMLVGFLAQWPYWAVSESSGRQATLGKRIVGIIVIDQNGSRISFARASARYVARVIAAIPLYLGLIVVAFDGKKRGLHDRMAGTLVIKKASLRA